MPEGLNVSERYERQRMDVVSRAMKDAKHIVRFFYFRLILLLLMFLGQARSYASTHFTRRT